MMLMASLSILRGATARTPFFSAVLGDSGPVGAFGPIICLGAALLLLRCAMTRSVDRWFVGGLAAYMVVVLVASKLLLTDTWMNWASAIFKL